MSERLRVAVIGTGYLGRLHTRVLSEMPEVELAGFVEPSDEVAGEVAAKFGIRRFANVAEAAVEIDAAVVATPTEFHAAVMEELLLAGRDVMVEKPITSDVGDARRVISLAAERGRIIQVGHVERFNPAIVAVAPLVSGQTRYVVAERLGVFSGRSLDIDVLLDLMIHDLNLVLSLLGSDVSAIQAVGVPVLTDKVDIANVRLELTSGAVANLTASRVSSDRVRKIRFFGSDSYISVDTKEQEVKGYRLAETGAGKSIMPLDVTVEKKEPLRAELEGFVSAVRNRTAPLVTAEDGLAALDLAVRVGAAIDQSLQSWRGVR